MNQETLNLRDIHLPEPISWWPLAPGWWLLLALIVITAVAVFLTVKIYRARQLKRDIRQQLTKIKHQFSQSDNKTQLAKDLSALLRRANISYYPQTNIAGLTGENWLLWLDNSHRKSTGKSANGGFLSKTGKILLSAPYLPEQAELNYDSDELINLCETWLLGAHKSPPPMPVQNQPAQNRPAPNQPTPSQAQDQIP